MLELFVMVGSALVLLALLAAAAITLLVLPVWMLIHCLRSRLLPNSSKMLLSLSIILAWPFGSLAYASFASQDKKISKLANFLIVALIVLSLLFGAAIFYFRSELLPEVVKRCQKIDFKNLSQEENKIIKEDLLVLQNEMQSNSFFSTKSLIALQLFELFQSFLIDKNLPPEELKEWIGFVASRDSMLNDSFGSSLVKLRQKTIQKILLSNTRHQLK